jgi:co-chaperonin GroES (HSP10)
VRVLRGRAIIREAEPLQLGRIIIPQDYYDKHRRDTKSHRGVVLDMGAPQLTRKGVEVPPGFRVGDVVHYIFSLQGSEQLRTVAWTDGKTAHVMAHEEVIAVEERESFTQWCPSVDDEDARQARYFADHDELEASR